MSDKTLVQHMAEVMVEVGYVQKDGKLDAFPFYTFASAEKVADKVRSALSERGIAVCGDCELVASEIIKTEKSSRHLVLVKHTLTFTDGTDSLSVSAIGEGMDSGDKAAQKANTVGVKYCLAKAFLISWGDDPEVGPQTDLSGSGAQENESLTEWLDRCEKDSITTAAKFSPWWKVNGEQVKKECGQESATIVYEAYKTFLARLKAEESDA